MKEIFVVMKISRVRRAEQVTGKLQYLPAISEEIEVDGTVYRTGIVFQPADRFGWRRFDLLGTNGMAFELGKIGTSSHYLFLALISEPAANAVRRFVEDVKLWTLREFLIGFADLPAGVRGAWPATWYRRDRSGELDPARPIVAMAPASSCGLAAAGADAEGAGEWNTSSTLEHAEELVTRLGEPK
jgi:hypothetical protein